MSDFINSAESRETSIKLMEAILKVAGGDEKAACEIWKEGATGRELGAIIELVTGNGQRDTTEFCWSGRIDWAGYVLVTPGGQVVDQFDAFDDAKYWAGVKECDVHHNGGGAAWTNPELTVE